MSSAQVLHDRYQAAFGAYCDFCAIAPERWHRPDIIEFTELRRLLLPYAESGDAHCQYALATIFSLGLCCESEEEFFSGRVAALEAATYWWIAAAKQGFWPAVDNLGTSGVGPDAERVVNAWRELERDHGDLVGSSNGMPVYGPEFVQELSRKVYGRCIADLD